MGLETSDRVREHVAAHAWNDLLHAQAAECRESAAEASAAMLSSRHLVLARMPNDPEEYEFYEDDTIDEGGRIWLDELHLTSKVDDILAEEIVTLLVQL